MEGGEGGEMGGGGMGGGDQRAVWENISALIWLVTRVGGWGRRGEVAHGGRARGERGGGTKEQCKKVHWFLLLLSLTYNWSDLAGDEGGGMGEAWGGGPWRAGKGGDGRGHQRAVCGNKTCTGSMERGWGDGGRRGEVAHGGAGKGGDGVGAPESIVLWEQQTVHWFSFGLPNNWFDLAGDEGGGMGGGVGRWPMEGGQGGRWGHQRAVWKQQKVHWLPLKTWLVTRVGGGGAWGDGPWRAGKGGDGGGGALVPPFWAPLKT